MATRANRCSRVVRDWRENAALLARDREPWPSAPRAGSLAVLDADGSVRTAILEILAEAGFGRRDVSPSFSVLAPTGPALESPADPVPGIRYALERVDFGLRAEGWRIPALLLSRAGAAREDLAGDPGAVDARRSVLDAYRALTARERDVARLVVSGKLNKQIADQLGIAERTVKIHRSRAMSKLGADSLPDLVRLIDYLNDVAGEGGK